MNEGFTPVHGICKLLVLKLIAIWAKLLHRAKYMLYNSIMHLYKVRIGLYLP
jgi:hypothetical protein